MKKVLRLVLLQICCLLTLLSTNAQVKNNIAKFNAFVVRTGSDRLHYLYAETTGKVLPQWNMVYTNSGVFAIQAEAIDSVRVTVGRLKGSSRMAIVSHKRGNRLWKLVLVPVKARTPADVSALLKNNDAVVLTEFGGKQFTHTIAKETELETLISR